MNTINELIGAAHKELNEVWKRPKSEKEMQVILAVKDWFTKYLLEAYELGKKERK